MAVKNRGVGASNFEICVPRIIARIRLEKMRARISHASSHASSHLACVLAYCVIVVGFKNDPYKKWTRYLCLIFLIILIYVNIFIIPHIILNFIHFPNWGMLPPTINHEFEIHTKYDKFINLFVVFYSLFWWNLVKGTIYHKRGVLQVTPQ